MSGGGEGEVGPRSWALAELLALTGLAVTQPVLDVFGNSPEVFVQEGAGALEIVAFAATIALLPAVALFVLELLVGLAGAGWRRLFHHLALGGLAAVFAMALTKDVTGADFGRRRVAAVGLVVGVAFFFLVRRIRPVSSGLRILVLAPVVFVALFLFGSPVFDVAFGSSSQEGATVEVGRPAPVIMVVLDELPTASLLDGEGAIDRVRFPNLARLADDATWYRNHTTVAPFTNGAVPALLTGQAPEDARRAPVAATYPENLFTLLGRSYEVHGAERVTQLCPTTICTEALGDDGGGLPSLLEDSAEVWREVAAPARPQRRADAGPDTGGLEVDKPRELRRTKAFAESLGPSSRPRLDVLHVLLPHGGWELLPSGQRYEVTRPLQGLVFNGYWANEREAQLFHQRHLLQLQATDRVVGRILDQLQATDRYDESLLVVTGDHGVSFATGEPYRGASAGNYSDIMWTPLLVKAPAQGEGEVDDAPARSIDVLPTIADHLDVDLPWPVDGRSLLGRRADEAEPRLLLDWGVSLLKAGDDGYARVDGRAGFAELLATEPPLVTDDADLAGFQWGAHGRLVGRPVDELDVGPPSPSPARIEDREAFDDVDVEGEVLPAFLVGEVDLPGDEPATVAVAVNGVVGATSTMAGDEEATGDTRRFDVVLPPTLFRPGANQLDLFLVEGEPGAERLRPLSAP